MGLNRKKFPLHAAYLLIISVIFLIGGCGSLPPNSANPETYAFQDTAGTRLGMLKAADRGVRTRLLLDDDKD